MTPIIIHWLRLQWKILTSLYSSSLFIKL